MHAHKHTGCVCPYFSLNTHRERQIKREREREVDGGKKRDREREVGQLAAAQVH